MSRLQQLRELIRLAKALGKDASKYRQELATLKQGASQ
jgi:hypothetical protein